MVSCLSGGETAETSSAHHRHAVIMRRLEELLEANPDRTLYVAELCAAAGASSRTLRACCQEHLGIVNTVCGLRRMHLARRTLRMANPAAASVTEIATSYGFWELGRFSVAYRSLFGKSPSAALLRPPDDPRPQKNTDFRPVGSLPSNLHGQPRFERPYPSGLAPIPVGIVALRNCCFNTAGMQKGRCREAARSPSSIPMIISEPAPGADRYSSRSLQGVLKAKLTWATLHCFQLLHSEEDLPRIAYVSLAPGLVFVGFATRSGRPALAAGASRTRSRAPRKIL